jgi:hypothetical protein
MKIALLFVLISMILMLSAWTSVPAMSEAAQREPRSA